MASKRVGSAAANAATSTASSRAPLRVVSLLPSATENFSALLAHCRQQQQQTPPTNPLPVLVGRSHECDFPTTAAVQTLPVLTAPRTAFTSSADTHDQVRQALADAASLYHLDAAQLVALAPDVILTQSTCKVCSIDLATVEASVCPSSSTSSNSSSSSNSAVPPLPLSTATTARIVTCNPTSLLDALVDQFETLGRALGLEAHGRSLAHQHRVQLEALQTHAQQLGADKSQPKPRVLLVEWLEPLFIGSTGWMREIVEAAGGVVVESLDGADVNANQRIDVVVVALCGLSLHATETEVASGRVGDWWSDLQQTQQQLHGRLPALYIVDGTAMFTRPTQRLLLALEWLVSVLHDPTGEWRLTSSFPYKQLEFAVASTKTGTKTGIKADTKADTKTDTKTDTKPPELLEIEELHRAACANKQPMYTDPATGYSVLTAHYLRDKRVCCGNGCRHCPFGHANVRDATRRSNAVASDAFLLPAKRKTKNANQTRSSAGGTVLWPSGYTEAGADGVATTTNDKQRDLVVMFWSGGKDSCLALSELYASYARRADTVRLMPQVVLLTTVDPATNSVAIQNIDVPTIAAQARALALPLYLVAVGAGTDYTAAVRKALAQVPEHVDRPFDRIATLVFGDLHLCDIRNWRDDAFGREYTITYPLWQRAYESELLPALDAMCERTGACIALSAVESLALQRRGWKEGDAFDWRAVAALNDESESSGDDNERLAIDVMGECGEFHTCVRFPGMA